MRVFVWMSYGNPSVFLADNPAQLLTVYNAVRGAMGEFYSKEDLDEALGAEPDLLKVITEREIINMLDWFGLGEHESFEWGTGFTKLLGR